MKEYTVKIDDQVIGKRKSERSYTHALVAVWKLQPEKQRVLSFHGSHVLAMKASGSERNTGHYTSIRVVEVEVREIVTRGRVRCTGLVLAWVPVQQCSLVLEPGKTYGKDISLARVQQCLKDATVASNPDAPVGLCGPRCEEHQAQDTSLVRVTADRIQTAAQAEVDRRWYELHVATFTAETCPIVDGRCRVHAVAAEVR